MFAWNSIDDVQQYLAKGVRPFPAVYAKFLEQLMEREQAKQLCLLPLPRLELYHLRLECKVRERIRYQKAA